MKRFLSILIAVGMICVSHSSTAQTGNELSTQLTSTKPNVVRVAKVKLFRSNPYRYNRIYVDNNDEVTIDDEDLMSPYRREDLFKIVDLDEELPEHILNKLAAARKKALDVYQKKWG